MTESEDLVIQASEPQSAVGRPQSPVRPPRFDLTPTPLLKLPRGLRGLVFRRGAFFSGWFEGFEALAAAFLLRCKALTGFENLSGLHRRSF